LYWLTLTNVALREEVTPISGSTIAERFGRFSGALGIRQLRVLTGFVVVAHLRAGPRYFEAQGLSTETDVSVKTAP
jgi:hypothetical protein